MSNIIYNFEITNDFTITDDNIQIKTNNSTDSLDVSGNIIIGSSSSDNAKLIIKNTNNSIIELKAKNSNNIETTKSITNKAGVLEFTSNASLNKCLYEFNVSDNDSVGFMNSTNKPGIVFGRAGTGTLSVNDYLNAHIFYSTVDGGSGDNALNFTGEKLIFNTSTGNYNTPSQAMIIDANGNVGMGTASPTVSLDVGGTDAIRIPVGTTAQKPSGQNGYIRYNTDVKQFEGYGNSNWGSLGGVMSVNQFNKITADNTDGLRFYTNASGANVQRMQILNDGNVGIGTQPTSSYKLDVSGNIKATNFYTGDYIIHDADTNTKIGFPSNNVFTIETSGVERMRVDSSGNVGIGESSPSAKLDVDGDAKINGLTVGKGPGTNNSNNTTVGFEALKSNLTGDGNTAIGYEALKSNTGGDFNTAVGYQSLNLNTNGVRNTAIGHGALESNTGGERNTAVGQGAMFNNQSGKNNTAVGWNANFKNTYGDNNTIIGYEAGKSDPATNLTNTTCLGYKAVVSHSNVVRLGNAAAKVLIGTSMTTNPTAELHVDGAVNVTGDITAFYTSSDKRLKTNIKTIENPLQIIKNIRGVRFNWNEKAMEINNSIDLDKIEMGVIAQEIEEYIPEIIKKGLSDYMAVRYEKIAPLLIEGIKAQQTQIDIMKTQIEKQQEQIDELKELIKKC